MIGGKPVFLSYLPAGSYVGEMALLDGGRRTATVRAAIQSEVIRLDGAAFRRLLERKPALLAKSASSDMAGRQALNDFVEAKKDELRRRGRHVFVGRRASWSRRASARRPTSLLIDETLCVGCDNCERPAPTAMTACRG